MGPARDSRGIAHDGAVAGVRSCARSPGSSTTVEERCPVLTLPANGTSTWRVCPARDRHELRRKDPQARARACRGRRSPRITRRRGGTSRSRGSSISTGSPRSARHVSWTNRWSGFFAMPRARWQPRDGRGFWFLEHEGAAVASFLCFEYAGSVGLYNSGFDPVHARLAPGIVLLAHVIMDAIDRRIPIFDFPPGRGALQAGLRSHARRSLPGERPAVKLRVAMLSVHTCPAGQRRAPRRRRR
jgi:hypothetical protein